MTTMQAHRSQAAEREVRRDSTLRQARTCYDHLAGVAGVALFEEMARRGWVQLDAPAEGDTHPICRLTDTGLAQLRAHRIDVASAMASKRTFAYACLDWTERRPHLAGALGAAVLAALERDGVVDCQGTGRSVRLKRPLASWLDAQP